MTDPDEYFFVLNPPLAGAPDPDMDQIRAQADRPRPAPSAPSAPPGPATALERFEASMLIDYEKWHDGIGYDLDALAEAGDTEKAAIEQRLISRGGRDWRDIEALAAVGTGRAREALRQAFAGGGIEVRMAVLRHAPDVVTDEQRTAALVEAFRVGQFFGGLAQALDLAAEFHPEPVIEALFRGALERAGENAVHCAALLYFIYGKAKDPFDWDHRPFYLEFNTERESDRIGAFRRLCADVGVDPGRYSVRDV